MAHIYFSKRQIIIFLTIINILPIVSGFIFINLFAVNVPFQDQFHVELPPVLHSYEGTLKFSDFLALNNDNRPIFFQFLSFAILALSRFNTILEANVGYFLHVLAFIIIWILIKNEIPGLRPSSIYILPLNLFFFNFYLISAYLWGILLSSSLCLLAMACMIYSIHKCKGLDIFFFAALFSAIVGMFSWTAGLFLMPAGLVQFWLSNKYKKNLLMSLWTVIFAALIVLNYLVLGFPSKGPHGYGGYMAFLSAFFHFPIQKGIIFIEVIGSNIVHDIGGALGFGFLMLIVLIYVLYLNRNQIRSPDISLWLTILIYATLVNIALVLARSGDNVSFGSAGGIFFLPAVRQYPSIFIFVVGLYGLILATVARDIGEISRSKKMPEGWLLPIPWNSQKCIDCALLGFIVAILLAGFFLNLQIGLVHGVVWAEKNTQDFETLKEYQTIPSSDLQKIFSTNIGLPTDKETVQKLEYYNLSVFGSSSSGLYPKWLPQGLREKILNSSYIKSIPLT